MSLMYACTHHNTTYFLPTHGGKRARRLSSISHLSLISNITVLSCHQRVSSVFDLLLFFLCSLITTLTLTPPPLTMHVGKPGHLRGEYGMPFVTKIEFALWSPCKLTRSPCELTWSLCKLYVYKPACVHMLYSIVHTLDKYSVLVLRGS